MAAWKKWWISFVMMLQVIVGVVVISLWFYRDQTWIIPVNDWLYNPIGQDFSAGVAVFSVIVTLIVVAIAIFRSTVAKQMAVTRDGVSKVRVDQHVVEHSLTTSITKFDLYNPTVNPKIHRNNHKADVTVYEMLSKRTNPKLIHTVLLRTIKGSLKRDFNIDLNKLHIELSPYSDRESVNIV